MVDTSANKTERLRTVFLRAYIKMVIVAIQGLQHEMRRLQKKYGARFGPRNPPVVVESTSQNEVLSFCHQMAPFEVDGYRKIRVGNDSDGGYIFIDDFTEGSAVILCGISDDVSCDYALAERGKTVVQFDHTVKGPPISHAKFRFRKQAIDALGLIPRSVKLWDVVEEMGDRSKADLLLKIDVEGEEWMTFAEFPLDALKRFRQISCEFHRLFRLKEAPSHSLYLRALKNISTSFFPIHLHANNFTGFKNVAGVAVPEVLEVTFANRDLYRPSAKQRAIPTELDRPNNPDAPELFLGSLFLETNE